MHVLVVEDDEITRETFRQILERSGYSVTAVENAIAGYAEVQRQACDVIVCDLRLPFMGGDSFFQHVTEDAPELSRRFIFVTGYADDPGFSAELRDTRQPVLEKPIDFREFVSAVNAIAQGGNDRSG